jgi:hypothetical protein
MHRVQHSSEIDYYYIFKVWRENWQHLLRLEVDITNAPSYSMTRDCEEINQEYIILRDSFSLLDLWALEQLAAGKWFELQRDDQSQLFIVTNPKNSWITLARLQFGK